MNNKNLVIKFVMTLMVLILGFFLVSIGIKAFIQHKSANLYKPDPIIFSQQTFEKHVTKGDVVIVRFTADWCITCKIMDIYMFDSEEVVKFIEENGIIYMLADITSRHELEAMQFMKDNKIPGVPALLIASAKNPAGDISIGMLKKDEFIKKVAKHL